MPGKDIHGIPESSCFFQGHIGQFFSKSGYSFRIQSNYSDPNKLEDINTDKYKPIFLKIINRKIAARNSGGGTLQQVAPVDLVINAVKLIDEWKGRMSVEFLRFIHVVDSAQKMGAIVILR